MKYALPTTGPRRKAVTQLLRHEPQLAQRWVTPCWDNLQKLDFPYAIGFRSYGLDIAMRSDDGSLLPAIIAALPHPVEPSEARVFQTIFSFIKGGRQPGSRTRRFYLAYQDHTKIARTQELPETLEAFSPWFRLTVGARAPHHVFIHAGVVEYRGRAILVPGRTMAGKSTLVRALVNAGARYMSDDFAVLDADGNVFPYPKPLTVRDATCRQHIIEMAPARVEVRSLAPAMILFTEYRDSERFAPEPLTPGKALLGLLDNCLTSHSDPERVTSVLANLAGRTVALIGRRGAADGAARKTLELFDAKVSVRD